MSKNINKLFALEGLKWRKIQNKATDKQALLISTVKGDKKVIQGKHHLTSLKDFVEFVAASIGSLAGKWGIKSEDVVQPNATYLNFKGPGVTVAENQPNLDIEILSDMRKAVYDGNGDGVVNSSDKVEGVGVAGNSRYYGTDGGGAPGFHTLPSAGQIIYDGVDTEAIILAKDPTASAGEVWWSSDTKTDYRAISSGSAGDVWQKFSPVDFKASNDTWSMPDTADGHSLDLGQETFVSARNVDITGATTLDPKVFAVSGIDPVDPKIKEVVKVLSGDINVGVQFGINTVVANSTELTKITTFGTVNDINTSGWSLLDILYISSITAGDLTNIKPTSNAFVVGQVLKVHATEGVLEVVASKSIEDSPAVVPAGITFSWFTADQTGAGDPAGLNNFYHVLANDQGIIASATQLVTVPDDSIVGVSKDHLGVQAAIPLTTNLGIVAGSIQFELNSTSATKKFYIEIYHAQADGTVIDVINSLPVGDRGVRPIVVLESSITDPASGTILDIQVQGTVVQAVTLATGERLRYHILCEKIGILGPSIDFTIYYGSDHSTRVESQKLFFLDDLVDVEIVTPQNGESIIYDSVTGLWKNGTATAAAAGADQAMQFNDGGTVLGSDPNFTYNKATEFFRIGSFSSQNFQWNTGSVVVSHGSDNRKSNMTSTGTISLSNTSSATTVFLTQSGDSYINGGNVGIGITAPNAILHIKRAVRDATIKIESVNSDIWSFGVYDFLDDDSDDFYISGTVNSTEAFVIKRDSGNVGIGTTAPSANLHITDTASARINFETADSSGWIRMQSSLEVGSPDTLYIGTDTGKSIAFNPGNAGAVGKVTFAADGNVGIGTTTPGSKLSVVGLPTSTGGLSAGDIWNDAGTLKIV